MHCGAPLGCTARIPRREDKARVRARAPRPTGNRDSERDELLALELCLEAVEYLVHLRPALELLHVVEPARDVRVSGEIASDEFAERHKSRAEIVRDRDGVAGEILVLRPDVVVVEHLQPALRLLGAPGEGGGLRLVAAPL